MNYQSATQGRDSLAWWLQQLGIADARFSAHAPDYLIVSPPKTGSTWLADNLRVHPEIFVPSIKEIKYFSSFYKSLDLGWYLDQLAPGEGRIKGEASPSYSLLPVERIRLIRWLRPDLKIVFLMRDPIERAWSHAKHNYKYREANFTDCKVPFEAVTQEQWLENFTQDWTRASGDYLGQLRRWLAVYPREQVYVGFYESIATEPEKLLQSLFRFLGVAAVDLHRFPTRDRILPGMPGDLSTGLRQKLQDLWHSRTQELIEYLHKELELDVPQAWNATIYTTPSAEKRSFTEFDDLALSKILAEEERFPSAWSPILGDFRGYNLIWYRGQVYALDLRLGNLHPRDLDVETLDRYQRENRCFVRSSVAEMKATLERHVYEVSRTELEAIPALVANVESRLEARLESRFEEARHRAIELGNAVQHIQAKLHWLRPWFFCVERMLRPVWRRLRKGLGAQSLGTKLSQRDSPTGRVTGETVLIADRLSV